MFKNKFLLGLIAVVILGVVGYTFFGEETTISDDDYVAKINQERKNKDNFFRTSEESPLVEKAGFEGLNYFSPNPSLKIVADIIPYDSKAQDRQVAIPMTDGTTETYEKYGFAEFTLPDDGKSAELNVYRLLIYKQDKGLSILFRDATAPGETYGGGRYLDFKADDLKSGKLIIDFNNAYNPYCAYNYRFSCPLPPKENTLPVRIEAGEKSFENN